MDTGGPETLAPDSMQKGWRQLFNAIEKGAIWPKAESVARAAFMANEEGIELDPLSYRVLTMLPAS